MALGRAVAHVVAVARGDRAAGVHGRRVRCTAPRTSSAGSRCWRRCRRASRSTRRSSLGVAGTVLAFALFVCTGMIYACLPFLREWATPAHGRQLHAAGRRVGLHAGGGVRGARRRRSWSRFFAGWALVFTLLGCASRVASLVAQRAAAARSRRCRRRSASSIRGSCRSRRASWAARSTRASSSTAGARRSLRVGQVGLPAARLRGAAGAARRGLARRAGGAARRRRSSCSTSGCSPSAGSSSRRRTIRRTSTTRPSPRLAVDQVFFRPELLWLSS